MGPVDSVPLDEKMGDPSGNSGYDESTGVGRRPFDELIVVLFAAVIFLVLITVGLGAGLGVGLGEAAKSKQIGMGNLRLFTFQCDAALILFFFFLTLVPPSFYNSCRDPARSGDEFDTRVHD